MEPLRKTVFALLAALSAVAPAFAQEIVVKPERPGGVYGVGETIRWTLTLRGDGAAGVRTIGYVLKKGMLTPMGSGALEVRDGVATLETRLDEPGSVYAELTAGAGRGAVGALVAPEKIAPSAPTPKDFDAFWRRKLKELAAVPAKPELAPAESGDASVEYAKITLDNIRGTKVRGQIARPKAPGKRPALLIVQWAGVYPLQRAWAVDRAREGWLTLNINAHDLPIDEPEAFYRQKTDLQNYPAIGNEDRETSYFLRMYLSCYRAADYLTSRDDWDGKTLVVMGASQGGLQALMLAGLHPKVTACIANVPAGCDQTGPAIGRQAGWPMWHWQVGGKDAAKVRETSRYYDVVNFARRIQCPTLVALGLIDTVCPPHGIAAACNQMRGPKELLVMERSDHQGQGGSQAAFYARSSEWLKALAAGKKPTRSGR